MSSRECSLCDLPTPDPPVSGDAVEGEFCCRGCLEVAKALGTDALEGREGDELDREAIERAVTGEKNESADADQMSPPENACETAYLTVDGMHCATCETFLEAVSERESGVVDATASYATDTMRIRYDPESVDEEDLPSVVTGTGYTASFREVDREPESGDVAVVRFLIGGGFFGMMAMLWYVLFLYPTYFGFQPVVEFGQFDRLYLFTQIWLFTSVVLFYTGFPILRGAYVSLRARQPNMDLLVSLAASSAYLYSTIAMLVGRTDLYFDVTVAVIVVVTAGNYYESHIKRRAMGLLSTLAGDRIETVRREDGTEFGIENVSPGDRLLVKPGERIPFDGTVRDGAAAIDEAVVTGESLPVTKRPGDEVVGGSVVADSPLVVEVADPVESTRDRLVEQLWEIQSARSGVQHLADKLATVFVPLVTVLAVAITALFLLTGASPTRAFLVGLTVLIVSCPCALGLATPLAVASGVRTAADRGIVVATETIFEDAAEVDIVALDKTGTLTEGRMQVVDVVPFEGTERHLLEVAAAVERFSEHPVADAIVERAAEGAFEGGAVADGGLVDGSTADSDPPGGLQGEDDSASEPGHDSLERAGDGTVDAGDVTIHARGVEAALDGGSLLVGHPSLFDERNWTLPEETRTRAAAAAESGHVPVVVGRRDAGGEGEILGVLVVGDAPRAEWDEVVAELAGTGREIVVLTGDDSAAATHFESHPDVSSVFAGVPPEGKTAAIQRLRSSGVVAMIGDGTNDAPALAAADLGVAMAEGTELSADAADAVITGRDLSSIPTLFAVSSATNRRIRQNLGWAFVYNGIAIPLALTGLLNPLFAAAAMATSSLLVVLNSSRRLL
ncbi:Cation transport ATPase [Halalkaliarchaeum sp. AArc-CO]|uniref:heavy metal translocating P-type ATPase n=1 Tax=unclassified Halalkaliarchaeum TaxID=2678344 RepID=UPI00217DC81B|nr:MULTISPECIES: cation-translocating P-type ATPase [unclassified Halalkaliarchaeum]MDR5671789.1 cation-translocating P-type ATPase [Halalkaliarchaeum sp. AArc-GB]UWG51285.1 Cation transport ATPase [Halalkaliarchaeum sp. AArc-CO]